MGVGEFAMVSETGRSAVSDLSRRFLRDETAMAIPEYGLLVALLSVAVLLGYEAVGGALIGLFNKLGNQIINGMTP